MSDADLSAKYLDAYRKVHDPGSDAAAAALARLHARIEAGAADPVADADEVPPRSGVLIKIAFGAVALAAAVLLAWQLDLGGWIATRGDDGKADHSAAYAGEGDSEGGEASRRQPKVDAERGGPGPGAASVGEDERESVIESEPGVEVEPEVEAETGPEPGVEVEPEPAPNKIRRPRAKSPADPSPSVDATLEAELALLKSAQSALAAGNAARALQQLDRHAKSFPDSMLAEEREVARIEALCDLGKTTKVTAAKKAFARKFPGSPLSGRAKSACTEVP